MLKKISISFFILIIVWSSCKHEPIIPEGEGICFESQILPIFQSSCAFAGCHDVISAEGDYIFTDYANIMASGAVKPGKSNNSKVVKYITENEQDDIMPPPPYEALPQESIDLIIRWINEGAKNTTNCTQTCNPNAFTFAADILPILQNHCIGCHSGSNPDGGINLSNYSGVSAVASNSKLIGSISHLSGYSAMPKSAPKLDDCNITKIKNWIDNGEQNN